VGRISWQHFAVAVAAAAMLAVAASATLVEFAGDESETTEVVLRGLLVWAGLLGAVYLVGLAVTWILKRPPSEHG